MLFVVSKDDVNFNPPPGTYLENYDWNSFRDIMHRFSIEVLTAYSVPFNLLQGDVEHRREVLLKKVQPLLEFREGKIIRERE